MEYIKQNHYKILYIILLIIAALPACYLNIGFFHVRFSVIITFLYIVFWILLGYSSFLKNVFCCIKNKYSIFLLIVCLWIVISGIVNCFLGNMTVIKLLFSIFFRLIPLIIIPYFLGFVTSRKLSIKTVLKGYSVFIIFILLIGLLNQLLILINNQALLEIFFGLLVNNREDSSMHYIAHSRIQSVFDEPSYFGFFISVHIIYMVEIIKSKYKLFYKTLTNKIFKIFLAPIFILSLLLVKSPIYILISVLAFFTYYALEKKNTIYKFLLFASLCMLLFCLYKFLLSDIQYNNLILYRIQIVLRDLTDIKVLVQTEPSLATRIVNYINQFIVFKQHKIFGVGFGNLASFLHFQFTHSPVPLTDEIITWLKINSYNYNFSVFWSELPEIGIIGVFFLYNVFFATLNKARILFQKEYGINKIFLKILFSILLMFVLLTIYDSTITSFIWGIIGLIAGYKPCKYIKVLRRIND